MHPIELGRTLIIVNPVAQSGKAAAAADRLGRFLALYSHDASAFHVKRTERPRHATELAAAASGFDTVLALGGDGVVHEVANGLMRIEPGTRPTLGVVPVGSGNDFARSLGLTDVADVSGTDFSPLLHSAPRPCDILRVAYGAADGAPGSTAVEYALETVSFGLDAAIAMDTHAMRRRTKLTGTPLYLASGLKTFGSGYRTFASTVRIDGEAPRPLETIIFAVQNGATYGSGFRICPDADISESWTSATRRAPSPERWPCPCSSRPKTARTRPASTCTRCARSASNSLLQKTATPSRSTASGFRPAP